ncbi:MAG: tRNA (adenosine(37)-N6)-threonylcarbamoyltransferase complex dimerization subunit type 1 TsaB [Treponemataceae bacterium]
MKALAIDSSTSFLSIYAVNEKKTNEITLFAPQQQSEKLIPLIEQALAHIDLSVKDLEFTVASLGPGSFTGLRLSFAALKALMLAYNIPFYGVPTLFCFAQPYANLPLAILPVIDARKERFYFSLYKNGKQIITDSDTSAEMIIESLARFEENQILIVGHDAKLFFEQAQNLSHQIDFLYLPHNFSVAQVLFEQGKELFLSNAQQLTQDASPLYIRASEAEENYKSQ